MDSEDRQPALHRHFFCLFFFTCIANCCFAPATLSACNRGVPLKSHYGWWDGFALIGWSVYFAVPDSPWTQALFPFLLLVLCAAALCSRYLRFFFSNQTIAVIGGMCYSIYLLHFLLIAVFFKVTRYLMVPQNYLATFLIQVLVTEVPVLLLCALYYAGVERVFMDPEWPAKLWKRVGGRQRPAIAALDKSNS